MVKDYQWNRKCVQKPKSLLSFVEWKMVQLLQTSAAKTKKVQTRLFISVPLFRKEYCITDMIQKRLNYRSVHLSKFSALTITSQCEKGHSDCSLIFSGLNGNGPYIYEKAGSTFNAILSQINAQLLDDRTYPHPPPPYPQPKYSDHWDLTYFS